MTRSHADQDGRLLLTHSAGCVYDAAAPDMVKYRQQQDPKYVPNTGTTVLERFTYPLQYQPGEVRTCQPHDPLHSS